MMTATDLHSPVHDETEGELLATLTLTLTPGLGPVLTSRLITHFGSALNALNAAPDQLRQVERIGPRSQLFDKAALRGARDAAAAELEAVRSMNNNEGGAGHSIRLIGLLDPTYPLLLKSIPDPPPILYVRGELRPDDSFSVAIVGTRNCSVYGQDQSLRFASMLAQSGLTIVSGGARGIDTQAHRGALRADGRTIVVAGCGLAHDYPPENAALFAEIIERGCGAIVSEFPLNTSPSRENFPRRNRIISGLSLGTLVIEAGDHSGALITARHACDEQQREVMALPGRVDTPLATGCHRMIREGWATLVTNHQDVLEALKGTEHLLRAVAGESAGHTAAHAPTGLSASGGNDNSENSNANSAIHNEELRRLALTLSESQKKILETIEEDEAPSGTEIADIAVRTGLPIHVLQSDITILQIRGLIARSGGGAIERRRKR